MLVISPRYVYSVRALISVCVCVFAFAVNFHLSVTTALWCVELVGSSSSSCTSAHTYLAFVAAVKLAPYREITDLRVTSGSVFISTRILCNSPERNKNVT